MSFTPAVRVLVVTGLSGAGKTTALGALADVGYQCVDNLPLSLLAELVRWRRGADDPSAYDSAIRAVPLAIGIDTRDRAGVNAFTRVREALAGTGVALEVLYLEAPYEVLVRRFAETRRVHPLGHLPDAAEAEAALLARLRESADVVLDTATLHYRELRRLVRERYALSGALSLRIMSFGFKNGVPSEADLVFDARFLANPFEDRALRPLSGLDRKVSDFVLGQPAAVELLERIEGHLRFQLPQSLREGRASMIACIGCTGGLHRSVTLVEALAGRLRAVPIADAPIDVGLFHRDMLAEQALLRAHDVSAASRGPS